VIGGRMSYIFPSTIRHLPNDEQLEMLISLLNKEKFPGFLNPSSLQISIHKKERKNLYELFKVDDPYLTNALKNAPYLFIPYDKPIAYILSGLNDIIGIITHNNLETYWLENTISLHELWTAQRREIPIIIKFDIIGRNKPCELCMGYGAIDWVEHLTVSHLYKKVRIPENNYIIASHKHLNFLVNNKDINEYDGPSFIHICPRCAGMGCDGVLIYTNWGYDQILMIDFKANKDHHLLIRDARDEIIETPQGYYRHRK